MMVIVDKALEQRCRDDNPIRVGMIGAGFMGRGRIQQLTLENYRVRDLWEHKDLNLKESSMYIELPPHSVKVYRFIAK